MTDDSTRKKKEYLQVFRGCFWLDLKQIKASPPIQAQQSKPDIVNRLYLPKSTTNLNRYNCLVLAFRREMMVIPSCQRSGLADQVINKGWYTAHKCNWYINGWMLSSPFATSEGDIDVTGITNRRRPKPEKEKGKTGVIGVRHLKVSKRSWIVEGLVIGKLNHPAPFIICPSTDCLVGQEAIPIPQQ